jgi:hypothetical protein
MKTNIIDLGDKKLVEYISEEVLINNVQDALDLMANTPSAYLILYEKNFNKEFFDLNTGILGEILQKFTNYKVRLAIIGDFEKFKSKSLRDFIYESNKNGEYLFVDSIEKVKEIWKFL